jgi:hypothetical protein
MHSPKDIKGVVVLCHSSTNHLPTFRFTPQCLPTDEHHRQLPEGCPPTPSLVSSGRHDRSKSQSTNSPSANSTINTTPTPGSSLHRESIGESIPPLQSSLAYTPMTNLPSSSQTPLSLSSTTSTSNFVERITAQQHAIEERLTELKDQQNIESIRVGIKNTSISAEENMNVDVEPQYSYPKPIGAKQRALMRYVSPSRVSHMNPCLVLLSCNTHYLICGG